MMTLQPQPAPVLEARASSPVSRSATMAKEASERLLEEVWSRLAAFAKEETRAWFEETARHLGRWRGNQADACRRAVREACEASRADASAEPASVSVEARYRAAFELMRSEFCDDKLAGMILFEVRLRASPASDPTPLSPIARAFETTSFLHPRALVSAPRAAPRVPASRPRADPSRVPLFPSPQEHVLPDPSAAPFLFPLEPAGARTDDADAPARDDSTDGFPALRDARLAFEDPGDSGVHDWSTSDWIASKVLGPYVAAHPRPRDAARALMAWSALPADAATPWMRRAGLTSFVNLVEGDGGSPSPRTRNTSLTSSSRARGGDDLFGDGFVLELASACGAALGAGGSRVPTSSFSPQDQDPGETADPTGDPEAWVRVGARWMLSLCVRECDRAEKERRAHLTTKTNGEDDATRVKSPTPTRARSKRRRVETRFENRRRE